MPFGSREREKEGEKQTRAETVARVPDERGPREERRDFWDTHTYTRVAVFEYSNPDRYPRRRRRSERWELIRGFLFCVRGRYGNLRPSDSGHLGAKSERTRRRESPEALAWPPPALFRGSRARLHLARNATARWARCDVRGRRRRRWWRRRRRWCGVGGADDYRANEICTHGRQAPASMTLITRDERERECFV